MSEKQVKCDHIVCDDNGKLLRASDYIYGRLNDVPDFCPTCNRIEVEIAEFEYCPMCGGKIDWRILRIVADYQRRNKAIDKYLLEETGETFSQMLDKLSGDSDECDERIIDEYNELMLRRNRDDDGDPA